MSAMFSARRAKREHDQEAFHAQLYQQIGQLKVEWDWVNKKAGLTPGG
jgi:transposase